MFYGQAPKRRVFRFYSSIAIRKIQFRDFFLIVIGFDTLKG